MKILKVLKIIWMNLENSVKFVRVFMKPDAMQVIASNEYGVIVSDCGAEKYFPQKYILETILITKKKKKNA